MYFPLELPLGKHIPLYGSIPGRSFRLRHHPETVRPSLSADSGMRFPPGLPLGKRVPACVDAAFSLRSRPAQSSILRGTGGSVDVAHGRLRFDNIASI